MTVVARVPCGAGGQLTGGHCSSDGRMCVKADVYDGYWWDSTAAKWYPLFDKPSIGSYTQSPTNELANGGLWEVAVAENTPSVLNRVYAIVSGKFWVRDGVVHGTTTTWTQQTNFPRFATYASPSGNLNCNPNGSYKFTQRKMVVDPNNQNVVYVATDTSGIQRTLDGGATWTRVASATITGGDYWGGAGLAIDGNSGTILLSGVTVSKNIILTQNTIGAWASNDGGATWTQIANGTSSPKAIWNGRFAPDGAYWCTEYTWAVNASFPVWKAVWNGTSWVWTNIQVHAMANVLSVVPTSTVGDIVFVTDNGRVGYRTTTNGSTLQLDANSNPQWQAGTNSWNIQIAATDIPWLANEGNFTNGDVFFNPVDGKVYCCEGVGVWNATWTSTPDTGFTWQSQSKGIEELVANGMVHPPGAADPFFANSDRGVLKVANSMAAYPSTYIPSPGRLYHGWEVGYATTDSTFMYAICNFNGLAEYHSCYSVDGGSNWTEFADQTPANTGFSGGSMAFKDTNVGVWIPAQNKQQAYSTTNRGATWAAIQIGASGLPQAGWSGNHFDYSHGLCCDRGDGTFYAFNNQAGTWRVYKSSDAINWSNTYSGAAPGGSSTTYAGCKGLCPPSYIGGYNITGHVWFCAGPDAASSGLAFSTDHGATWTTLSNISNVWSFAFSKPRSVSTSSYPPIYAVGTLTGSFADMGLQMSEDMGATWTTIVSGLNPAGTLDQLLQMGANENAFGRAYLGYLGSGWVYVDLSSTGAPPRFLGAASLRFFR